MANLQTLWQWRFLAPFTGLSLLALAVVPLYVDGARHQAVAQGAIGTNKVIIDRSDTDAIRLLTDQGMAPFAEYDSFSLWLVTPAQAKALGGRAGVRDGQPLDLITTPGGVIKTRELAADAPEALRTPAAGEAELRLVQFAGPVKTEWFSALQSTGAQIVQQFPQNAYLIWANAEQSALVDGLATSTTFVQWSGDYLPLHRLDPALSSAFLEGRGDDLVDVDVRVYVNPGAPATISAIRAMSEAAPDYVVSSGVFARVQVRLPVSRIAEVAARPDVVSVTRAIGLEKP